jgi:hypothetical protein
MSLEHHEVGLPLPPDTESDSSPSGPTEAKPPQQNLTPTDPLLESYQPSPDLLECAISDAQSNFDCKPATDSPPAIAGDQEKPLSKNQEDASEDAELELEIKKIIEEIVEQHKPRFHSAGVLGPTLIPSQLERLAKQRLRKKQDQEER